MSWERVYTVENFYDCPRSGFANFGGKPHAYSCRFDQAADDWSDEYLTTEIDPELLAIVMEKWAIWQRWEEAFHKGRTTMETHPALAEERHRYMALEKAIEEQLAGIRSKSHFARANFRPTGLRTEFGLGDFEVEWTQTVK